MVVLEHLAKTHAARRLYAVPRQLESLEVPVRAQSVREAVAPRSPYAVPAQVQLGERRVVRQHVAEVVHPRVPDLVAVQAQREQAAVVPQRLGDERRARVVDVAPAQHEPGQRARHRAAARDDAHRRRQRRARQVVAREVERLQRRVLHQRRAYALKRLFPHGRVLQHERPELLVHAERRAQRNPALLPERAVREVAVLLAQLLQHDRRGQHVQELARVVVLRRARAAAPRLPAELQHARQVLLL
mmetsp:Transcript_24052/g.82035  ORF Transcript_24052/g.82035 Transcript_24052/m.82035 type:complete len:245 (+) Transcript_24052:2377-3111(+)